MKSRSILLMCLLLSASLGFFSCNLQGPAGALWPSFYLEDTNGTRYYSGGEVYLGYVNATTTSIPTTLRFVNTTNETVTLPNNPAGTLEYEFFSDYYSNSQSYYTVETNGQIAETSFSLSGPVTLAAGAKSASFPFTLTYTGVNAGGFAIKRRYDVVVQGQTQTFDFVFDVYGLGEGFSGW